MRWLSVGFQMPIVLIFSVANRALVGHHGVWKPEDLTIKEIKVTDQDKANQRAFQRKIADLINLLHDLGGTKRGSTQYKSAELAYASKALREAEHWVRDHYHTNVRLPANRAAAE